MQATARLVRRRLLWALAVCAPLLAVALGLWLAAPQADATGPGKPLALDKPITLVVTFPAGGGTDLLARRLAEPLQRRLGQPVIVENRPGASGNIAAHAVAQASADASTLLMVNSTFAINPAVYPRLDFDPRHDFRAVFNAGAIASVLVVAADSRLLSLDDALALAQPKEPLLFASCGNGTPQHLAGEMLAQAAKRFVQHVPYKGCAPAVMAVAAGQVPVGMVTASSAFAMVAAGRLRVLAVTSSERLAQWAAVPTVAEHGLAGFDVEQWHGLLAPAATPAPVVQALHAALTEVLREPSVRQMLREQGYVPVQQSPQQFQATINADIKRYAQVAQALGLRMD